MSRLMFVLSGEHKTLPAAEVEAAIKAERKSFKLVEQLDQLLVLETKANPEILALRLAMCREICYHLCTSGATEEEILEAVGSSDIVDLIPHGKTFAVRIERVKRSSPSIDTIELSKKVAGMIAEAVDFKVDLANPQLELLGILTGDHCAFGITAAVVDRKQFTRRRPTARPAFHPGTLKPVLARCMVNLARTPRGGTFLDPFCGVGGILLEAGIIGAKLVGVDIDEGMINGARTNLESMGIQDFQLLVGDARRLSALEVDAVATDPPYGRQSSTAGTKLEELYREALPSIAGVLKRRGYLCITSPAELELEELAVGAGLVKVEQHEQRVHRSLTRQIYVFRKK
ncbi:MAG: methyltransferase domain-containing protein [Candidatus Hadarchaeum sp.]|uniref:methyltransferase domain-containing protein n=1 Tax=Candidatus Hadarchaeum sp. TaxID=2883567 RepID=UPI003D0A9F77